MADSRALMLGALVTSRSGMSAVSGTEDAATGIPAQNPHGREAREMCVMKADILLGPGYQELVWAPTFRVLLLKQYCCLTHPAHYIVFQVDTGHYLCLNKYYGRGLSAEGFQQALYQYLHNGLHLRQDLFEPILSKLQRLTSVLESQASYRFYSSSLLIIYDGRKRLRTPADSPVPEPPPKVDVRMIDFAHSTYKGFHDDPTVHDGPDKGYVLGLRSLVSVLELMRDENQ
ncbi:hypothetical protein FKM82_017337 [Ascaphus truei]